MNINYQVKNTNWSWRDPAKIGKRALHIEVIADYGGGHSTDHAFDEVRNHFLRYDYEDKIRMITEHPVYAFSTLETGFWIAQEGLHSEHKNLVIFSNTAPRGDIVWHGEQTQALVCGLLDNGIPIFAVNAGYNLSFVKDRLKGLWLVRVPNIGTQFRSRDYYPEATMAILTGDFKRVGTAIDPKKIPAVPDFRLASVDGYGNLKTTITKTVLPKNAVNSRMLRISLNGVIRFVLNTLVIGNHGVIGDLCLVLGSSGGKKAPYLELVRLQGRAADDFQIDGPRDDLPKIIIEPVKI